MKLRWLWFLPWLCVLALPAWAETIHLTSGEIIQGRIIRTDDNTLSVESDKGYGVIQINKSDITLIEYDPKKRDPSRTIGVGYYHRTAPSFVTPEAIDYGLDALAVKYWANATDSIEAQLGFFSAANGGETVLQVFSLDARYATVFQRRGNLDLYYGGSLGFLSVQDRLNGNNISDTGTRIRVFAGGEAYFATFPNLGIAAEVGFGQQSVGSHSVTDLSTVSFPAFAVRYYF